MKPFLPWVVLIFLLATGCAAPEPAPSEPAQPAEPAPTAAAAPEPVREAAIIGAGTVSTAAPEFASSMNAQGTEIFFNRASDDRSVLIIMMSRKVDGVWEEAEAMPFSDGTYRDIDPFVTVDGSRVFFSSNRPGPGETEPGDFDIWFVERQEDEGWGEPVNVGAPVNTESTEIYSTLTREDHLYFSSEPGGERGIYRSPWSEEGFGEPERVVFEGGDAWGEASNPAISPGESVLVFAAQREDGLGEADLYFSSKQADGWAAPRRLEGPISSALNDFAPAFSWDGGHLFWTSERPGIVGAGVVEGRPPGDLYRISWIGE